MNETPNIERHASLSRILTTLGLFVVVALAVGWNSLDYPMVYDDLHVIRHFSGREILGAFAGHWDPDEIETPGFRPLTTLFHHASYHAFGENVVAHRLLLILLFAAFLTTLTWLAARIGAAWGAGVVAGVLCLSTVWSVFHTVWIADGNHTLEAFFMGLAGVGLVKGLESGQGRPFVLSIAFLAAGLLVREESLAAVPVLILVALVRAFDLKSREALKAIVLWTVVVAAVTGAFFVYRKAVIPNAPVPGANWLWWAQSLEKVLHPMGTKAFDTASAVAIVVWRAGFAGLLLLLVVLTWRAARTGAAVPRAWLWAAATFSGCLPSLTIGRQDLYIFASAFASLFVATAVFEVSRAYLWFRPLGILIVAWGVLGGSYASRAMSYNFHPWSLAAIWMNGQLVLGKFDHAPIPYERKWAAAERLAHLGIRSPDKLRRLLPQLSKEAIAAGHREPGPDGTLFVPRLRLNF